VRRKAALGSAFFAVGLLCVIIYFIAGQLSNTATANAWVMSVFSMQLIFTDLGPIFIIVFAAMLVAEENGRPARSAPRWPLRCTVGSCTWPRRLPGCFT